MTRREANRLAKVVRRCYKDGVLTQRELGVLSKVADRFAADKEKRLNKERKKLDKKYEGYNFIY